MKPQTFLGFDFGEKYIGVAVGRLPTRLAQPLETLAASRGEPDWMRVSRLIEAWQPDAFVVGLPLNMDDSENALTAAARRFGNRLRGRYNLPVHMVDERLTSVIARQDLIEAGVTPKRLKSKVDKLAAQTILQAFLDACDDDGPGAQVIQEQRR